MVHYGVVFPPQDRGWQLAIIVLFWSAFGLGMSPYYINRSVVSGQLQFLLVPAFLSGAAMLPLLLSNSRTKRDIALFIAALPCALSLASTIDHPSVNLALKRLLSNYPSMDQRYQPTFTGIEQRIARIHARDPNAPVAMFTSFGFVAGSALHLRSYLPLNSLFDLHVVPPSVGEHVCASLAADGNRFLIADWPFGRQCDASDRQMRLRGDRRVRNRTLEYHGPRTSLSSQALLGASLLALRSRNRGRDLTGVDSTRPALLAQDPQLLLLDVLARLARDGGKSVLMVLHDLHLALRYADHAIALGGGHASAGAADTILAAPALSALFGHPLLPLGEGRARTFVPA
jgi:hypothetical protein